MLGLLIGFAGGSPAVAQGPRDEITVAAALRAAPVTGRMYLLVSRGDDVEPRLQLRHESDCTPFFGVDVTARAAATPGVTDATTLGSPLASLRELPAGASYV